MEPLTFFVGVVFVMSIVISFYMIYQSMTQESFIIDPYKEMLKKLPKGATNIKSLDKESQWVEFDYKGIRMLYRTPEGSYRSSALAVIGKAKAKGK